MGQPHLDKAKLVFFGAWNATARLNFAELSHSYSFVVTTDERHQPGHDSRRKGDNPDLGVDMFTSKRPPKSPVPNSGMLEGLVVGRNA